MDSGQSIQEARRRLDLRTLTTQNQNGPAGGRWKGMVCPFCGKKGASVRDHHGRQWFKCFHTGCSSGSSDPGKSLDEVGYLALMKRISREEAFKVYLQQAGVWAENPRTPNRQPGTGLT